MPEAARNLLIADSSVLINFLSIHRLELLTGLPYKLLITDVVREEIQRRHQSEQIDEAIASSRIEVVTFTEPGDLQMLGKLRSTGLGSGEAVSIVAAARLQAVLAIDDGKAIKTALKTYPGLQILTTRDIMVLNIQRGVLTIEQADAIKLEWATQYRFALKIESFRLLIE
jgi:predicted nucleic acid-binding protein